MKNQESNQQIFQPAPQQNESQLVRLVSLFPDKKLFCSKQNPVYQYCSQEGCSKNAVICQKDQCTCQLQHQNCQTFFRVNKFHRKINQKVVKNTTQFLDQIDQYATKITDRISLMVQQYIHLFKTFGLNRSDQNILDGICSHFNQNGSNKQQILNGDKFFIHRQSYKESNKQWFGYSLEKYKKILQEAQSDIVPMFECISNIVTYAHIKNRPNSQIQHYFFGSKILQSSETNLFKQLQLGTKYLLETLQTKFQPQGFKKIYSYQHKKSSIFNEQLLLKAIENKENLIFLAKNTQDKRLGAFTTKKLSRNNKQSYYIESDKKNLSIGFSLNLEYSEQSSKSQYGLIYNQKNRKLQLGEVRLLLNTQIIESSNKFSINFGPNGMNVQLLFKEKIHPKRKNYNGSSLIIGYDQVNGKSKNVFPNGIPVCNLEVYQVEIKDYQPQIKEILGVKINVSQLQQEYNEMHAQGLFRNASINPFQQKIYKPSIFGQNQ